MLFTCALAFVLGACSTTGVPPNTPVPFTVRGTVVTNRGDPVPNTWVLLHERDEPSVLSGTSLLGQSRTTQSGSFAITVREPLTTGRLTLFALGRTYYHVKRSHGQSLMGGGAFTARVSLRDVNVIRVKPGFVPAASPRGEIVTVE